MEGTQEDRVALEEICSMGFDIQRVTRALRLNRGKDVQEIVQWLLEHEDDGDLDEPSLITKDDENQKLSEEESRKKAEEMMQRARRKKEEEEKKSEVERERMRIRMGKELLAAQRLEEEASRKRLMIERERERKEEEEAREKVRKQIEESRKEWRIRRGLPPEETEEEKEIRLQAEEKKKAEEEIKRKQIDQSKPFVRPVSKVEKIRNMLVEAKKQVEEATFQAFSKTILAYCANVMKHPGEEKYRRIKLTNAAFQQRVLPVPGALDLLAVLGFKKDSLGEFLVLELTDVDAPLLQSAGEELHSALNNPFFGVL